jgi:D-alanyl-D-alanine carboxypeptidase
MAAAGQAWSTIEDLARWAGFLIRGDPDVLSLEDLLTATHPQAGDRHHRLQRGNSLGFMLLAGGSGMLVGHSGSMPGFLAGCYVDRERLTGAVVLANATTGLRTADFCRELLELLEESEPTVMPVWRPASVVPPEYADLLGLWHWGRTPMVFGIEGDHLVVRVGGEVEHTFTVRDGHVLGVSGYHAGEPLVVVRAADQSVDHLELSTFVLTREPR